MNLPDPVRPSAGAPPTAAEEVFVFPASFAQRRLWFLDQLQPGSTLYNMPAAYRLPVPLDVAALERSLDEVVRRHEALRTTFAEVGGEPVQVILRELRIPLRFLDLRPWPGDQRQLLARQLADQEAQQPFDLGRGPLLRALLLRVSEGECILLVTMHHIASDGWSMGIFARELSTLYEAFSAGRPSPLPDLPIQYADFAQWQRDWLQGENLERLLSYWRGKLAGAPTVLDLPADRPRPPVQVFRGETRVFTLPHEISEGLAKLSRRAGATFFMTLLAAFDALLYRYTDQDDLVVGTPIANRTRAELEGLIGFFVNTLVLRARIPEGQGFEELLRHVREVTLEAYAHQDLPFERLVEELQPERHLGHNPLFQVVFMLQTDAGDGGPPAAPRSPDAAPAEPPAHRMPAGNGTAKFDLTLSLTATAQGLLGALEYNTDLFSAARMERLAGHFATLLAGIVEAPRRPLCDLPLLSAGERWQVLTAWNATEAEYPRDCCIHQVFEAWADRDPGAVAVIHDGRELTSGELDRRANRLAHALRRRGVGPEVLVGVFLRRSVDAVVALLGVLKAGGAYVPLDTSYPPERLAFMLEDTRVPVVLSQADLVGRLPDLGMEVLLLDRDAPEIARESPERPAAGASPRNLAYVMYTSGSTGRPKGGAILHRGVCRLVVNNAPLGLDRRDRVAQLSNLSFDPSTYEIWGALLNGAVLVIVTDDPARSPRELARRLREQRISVMFVTTAMLSFLAQEVPAAFQTVDRVIFGGEAADPEVLRRLLSHGGPRLLVNGYGPTECTVFSTSQPIESVPPGVLSIPIGRPIANTRLYILDRHGQPVPVGVPGELCVAGEGLGRHYHRRPSLTADIYRPDPFSVQPGARLYRTGDLARWLEDGSVDSLGRIDHQVKIRGFRVELGEIQAVLEQSPAVARAVVTAVGESSASRRLAAYVVLEAGGSATADELRDRLRGHLPEHMVPTWLVFLDALPLTPNGKVDRRALPPPEADRPRLQKAYVAPRDAVERLLAGIWERVLGVDGIGAHDNFFELGGHSLLATQVVSRIRESFRTDLPLRRLFEEPTIAGLARHLRGHDVPAPSAGPAAPGVLAAPPAGPILPVPRNRELPLSFAQERLWFLQQLQPESAAYHVHAGFRLGGPLNLAALEASLGEIVRRHEVLRTTFPAVDGRPVQVIAPALPVRVEVRPLAGRTRGERLLEAWQAAAEEFRAGFDLARGPLVRAALFPLDAGDHLLALTLHHIISDGWSMGLLARELEVLYAAFCTGRPSPLPELPIQYADFAAWQRAYLQGEVLESLLAFWRGQLRDAPALLELPTDRPRPAVQTSRGATLAFALRPEPSDALVALSRRHGATLFMTLLAAFQNLLYRLSGQDRLVVGSPIANRNRAEIEPLIGFFVNTLALHGDLTGEPAFSAFLDRVRETSLEAYAHQDLPFEKLVEELQPERNLSHNPLFQAMFVLQNDPIAARAAAPSREEPLTAVETGSAKFELTLSMAAAPRQLVGAVEYNVDLFDRTRIVRLVEQLEALLGGIAGNPDLRVSELPLLPPAQRHQVLSACNDTATAYPAQVSLHRLVAARLRQTPQAVAVVFEGRTLTCRQLALWSGHIARELRARGTGRGSLVGVFLHRSLEMVAGLLGILEAGGAYVPLDPSHPAERLALVMEDVELSAVLVQPDLLDRLPASRPPVLVLAADPVESPEEALPAEGVEVSPDDLAYVIHTSGSTGRPKGVMNTHRGICNRLLWMQEAYRLTTEDRVLQKTPFSFDVSVWEFFWPLMTGARLVVARPGGHQESAYLARLIAAEGVTTVHFVPSMLRVFLEEPHLARWCRPLRRVICSGEALPADLRDRFFARLDAELHNLYGPTEAAVDVTAWACGRRGAEASVPIGRPIANTQIYLLDRRLEPVPAGVPGELYIGGVNLARGYAGRPGLTAERFVPDPFGGPGGRLYRTGDLARLRGDGAIEYLGRIDHQVKIRGFRVELGEIEAVLEQHLAVQEAVVVTREHGPGDVRLAAYVVPDPQAAAPVRRLLRLEREGSLDGEPRHELPDGTLVFHRNRGETEFLYDEIFVRRSYLRHSVRLGEGACVFDVGANIGLFSLLAARTAGRATLFAFEPVPPVFAALRRNAELHGLDARLFACGLSDAEGEVPFTYYPHLSIVSGRFADAAAEKETLRSFLRRAPDGLPEDDLLDELITDRLEAETFLCPMRTLSGVIREHGVGRIDLLKVDVEKSELDVLAGLEEEDWDKVMQVVVEVHDLDGRLERIAFLLESRGFALSLEQDQSLAESGLFNVYAVRPGYAPPAAVPAAPCWRGPARLRQDLRDFLRDLLPEPMVPATWVLLDELPLTSSGKVDRRALPLAGGQEPGRARVPPRNPVEEKLAGIWQAVLGTGLAPGVHDNFFELGGHSLLATQVLSRLRDACGVELSLRAFFAAPTLAELAAAVIRQAGEGAAPPLAAPEIRRRPEEQQILESLDTLSDAEVSSLLRELLAEGGAR